MEKIYIVAAKRTAIGSFNGALAAQHPSKLAATLLQNIVAETGLPVKEIDEVIMGNVLSAGLRQGVARQAAITAGIPEEVPAYGVNMVCGSGMKAVMNATSGIRAGLGDVYFAGGTEVMSGAPYLIPGARSGLRLGDKEILDHLTYDSLTDAFGEYHMGITAENIAEKYSIHREQQDEFALQSQQKAIAAIDAGLFKSEIVPFTVWQKKAEVLFDTDEYPNRTTNAEKLAKLRPAFKKDGTVTAGNSSGINDGAAMLLIAGENAVKKYGFTPLAEIIGIGQGGVAPSVMGLGPVPAIGKALELAGQSLSAIDVFELNEAFAVQALGVVKELAEIHGLQQADILKKCNLKGGAIALGHPVGASGARILVSLVHTMLQRKAKFGLASLCIGGGMGTAVVLKSV